MMIIITFEPFKSINIKKTYIFIYLVSIMPTAIFASQLNAFCFNLFVICLVCQAEPQVWLTIKMRSMPWV